MKLLLVVIFFLINSVVFSQQFNFKKIAVEDGLPRSGIYHIVEDNDGFLLIGTEDGGFTIFDGANFKTYTQADGLASNTVRFIYCDKENTIWLGTSNGLSIIKRDSISTYSKNTIFDGVEIRSILEDDEGNIWIATLNNGAFVVDKKDPLHVLYQFNTANKLPSDKVRSIHKKQSGEIILGTDKGAILYKAYRIRNKLLNEKVICIYEDTKANLWFGTNNGVFTFENDSLIHITEKDGLNNNRVKSITEDRYGNMWFGTKKGINKYDGEHFIYFNEQNGLSNARIRTLYTDSWKNIWIGTYFGGINLFEGGELIHFTDQENIANQQINSIYEDAKGDIILGTYEGVSKLRFEHNRLSSVRNFNQKDGLSDEVILKVFKDSYGIYWYGTPSGITINIKLLNKNYYLSDEVENAKINDIVEVSSGNVLIGTDEGIFHVNYSFDQDEFIIQQVEKILNDVDVNTMIKLDEHVILYGTSNHHLGLLKNYKKSEKEYLQNVEKINHLCIDKEHNVYVASEGHGVYILNKALKEINHIDKKNGLSTNHILSICTDEFDNLWMGTVKGVDHIKFSKRFDEFEISHYSNDNGFKGIECNKRSIYRDSKGNVWFGTIRGASKIDVKKINSKTDPPKLFISEIYLKNELIIDDEYSDGVYSRFNLPKNLTLPYNENNISFNFTAIDYLSSSKVKLSWRLKGLIDNDDWTPLHTRTNVISYSSLPPGEYVFEIKAFSYGLSVPSEKQSFSFVIEKPIWKTIWFYITISVLGIIVFQLITQLRIRNFKKAEITLKNEVNIRTKQLREEKELVEKKNSEIENQHSKIEKQQTQLLGAFNELEEKNKNITDSIAYAKRIQNAILPSDNEIKRNLKDSFVLYLPKDIVAGDFYWLEKTDDTVLFASADCTGHGVPGAMVSVVCNNALNRSVREFNLKEPAIILDKTRELVIETFEKGTEDVKDGMDISLCALKGNTLLYAGANNPLWIVRRSELLSSEENELKLIQFGGYTLMEIKANKQPIGKFDNLKPFTQHEVELQKGDVVYTFTDGYADQFGGPKGKKFKYKPFKELLLSIQDKTMEEQREFIHNKFNDWKGSLEQVDDVCIIGVRI